MAFVSWNITLDGMPKMRCDMSMELDWMIASSESTGMPVLWKVCIIYFIHLMTLKHDIHLQVGSMVAVNLEGRSEMNTDKISTEVEAVTGKSFIILRLISLFKIFSFVL